MSRTLLLVPLVALAAALASPAAPAGKPKALDWPQFRGPKRDDVSVEKGLLKSWPKGGPRLLWKGTGVGQGFSSVSVAGDKVFTMGDKDGSSHVFALSRSTGKKLWDARVGRAGGNYAGTRCTPTVDGALVYALGQFGDLVCLEAATGEEVWRKNLPKDFGGSVGGWNYSESPLVDGDKLVCTPGGRAATVVALNKKTGAVLWKSGLGDRAEYSSLVVSEACGVRQYVQLTANGMVGVSARDGRELWRYDKLGGNTANVPTAVVRGNQAFCTAGYGKGGALLTLKRGAGGIEVEEDYYNPELRNKHGGVVAVGEYVYGDTDDAGRPWCAEWKTGKRRWVRAGRGKGAGSASLTYADGHLYVHYANGWVALVPADPKGYAEKGSFKIPNADHNSWAHPVVVGGRLYLREKDVVWCYDVKGR
jgi:outer membrane protein assembly factor BamB